MQKIGFAEALDSIVTSDPRYQRDAYVFLRDALDYTTKQQKKIKGALVRHVAGPELLDGVRQYALREFGPMVVTVFSHWGIRCTEDIGHMVFNLIGAGIFGKTEEDSIDDFKDVYSFAEVFVKPFAPVKLSAEIAARFACAEDFMKRWPVRFALFSVVMLSTADLKAAPPAGNSAAITAPPISAQKWVLPDGLTIIVQEDRSAPVASVQAWCATGSVYEDQHLGAGLSHILEHMLFKGTKTRPANAIAQKIQDVGGYINAYTSFDRTVYWIDVPKDGVATALDILSDAMMNSTLPPEEYNKEQEVIRREFAMGMDDPDRMAGQLLLATAYQKHPYRLPVIGQIEVYNQLTRDQVMEYYKARYVPNNLTFVVVGDVDAEKVREQLADILQELSGEIAQAGLRSAGASAAWKTRSAQRISDGTDAAFARLAYSGNHQSGCPRARFAFRHSRRRPQLATLSPRARRERTRLQRLRLFLYAR